MFSFSTQATASHRYYMRKSKAEIRRRIMDMLEQVDEDVLSEAMIKANEGPGASWPVTWLWFAKIGVPDCLLRWDKRDLATMAMRAHDFLPEPTP